MCNVTLSLEQYEKMKDELKILKELVILVEMDFLWFVKTLMIKQKLFIHQEMNKI